MLAKILGGVAVLTVLWIAVPQSASADQVICPPDPRQPCVIQIGDPGGGGGGGTTPPGGGGGGGQAECAFHTGARVPCYDPFFGWWNSHDECYYRLADPQPPPTDPAWDGHQPGDGAIYDSTCPGVPGTGTGWVWLQDPPPGFGGNLPPAVTLAEQALAKMPFPVPQVAMAPTEHTYVNFPTMLWIPASQWRPLSATAAIGNRSVTLTATPGMVTWQMGEGQVTCAGPGTPWDPAGSDGQASDCTYTYATSSIHQPGVVNDRAFPVRAVVTYTLHWECAGNCDQAAGDLAARGVPSQPARLRVLERQSVVIGSR